MRSSHIIATVVLLCVCALAPVCLAGTELGKADAPARKALIIGLDGTKGDVFHHTLFNTDLAPNFRSIATGGGRFTKCPSYNSTSCARAHDGTKTGPGFVWCTSPGWASVVTGVNNDKHGVKDNDLSNQDVFAETSKQFPTIMKLAKDNGLTTAASGAPAYISAPKNLKDEGDDTGIVDFECGLNSTGYPVVGPKDTTSCNLDYRLGQCEDNEDRDYDTTAFGLRHMEGGVDLIMTHFDKIDGAGHSHGFSINKGYLAAIHEADAQVGKMLEMVERLSKERNEDWLVTLTADHGGHGTSHGDNVLQDSCVPFMVHATGPTAPELTALKTPVRHFDVMPTVAAWLNLDISHIDVDGQVQGL